MPWLEESGHQPNRLSLLSRLVGFRGKLGIWAHPDPGSDEVLRGQGSEPHTSDCAHHTPVCTSLTVFTLFQGLHGPYPFGQS